MNKIEENKQNLNMILKQKSENFRIEIRQSKINEIFSAKRKKQNNENKENPEKINNSITVKKKKIKKKRNSEEILLFLIKKLKKCPSLNEFLRLITKFREKITKISMIDLQFFIKSGILTELINFIKNVIFINNESILLELIWIFINLTSNTNKNDEFLIIFLENLKKFLIDLLNHPSALICAHVL